MEVHEVLELKHTHLYVYYSIQSRVQLTIVLHRLNWIAMSRLHRNSIDFAFSSIIHQTMLPIGLFTFVLMAFNTLSATVSIILSFTYHPAHRPSSIRWTAMKYITCVVYFIFSQCLEHSGVSVPAINERGLSSKIKKLYHRILEIECRVKYSLTVSSLYVMLHHISKHRTFLCYPRWRWLDCWVSILVVFGNAVTSLCRLSLFCCVDLKRCCVYLGINVNTHQPILSRSASLEGS